MGTEEKTTEQAIITLDDLTTNQRALIASYIERAGNYESYLHYTKLKDRDFDDWSDAEKDALCMMITKWVDGGIYADVLAISLRVLVSFGAWLISPDPINEEDK